MTAGGGILHDELPTERMYRAGGPSHGVQLWVNLPPALKMTAPRYQSITRDALRLLSSDDGGALIRLIAGDIDGFKGPGDTHTPITYAHATLAPGAQLAVPWNPAFNALVYVLTGRGTAGPEGRPIEAGQLIVFGPGDHLVVAAADRRTEPLDVLLLGGLPIGAPIAHYGPFVMNTREEIMQAVEDYRAGRLGIIPRRPARAEEFCVTAMSARPANAFREAGAGAPRIARSAVIVGTAHCGEDSLIAEGAVIRSHGTGVAVGTGSRGARELSDGRKFDDSDHYRTAHHVRTSLHGRRAIVGDLV